MRTHGVQRIHMVSLGCPKNRVDSEVMAGLALEEAGLELCGRPEEAEVIVVNTCAFLGEAAQEAIDTILEMARFKEPGEGRCRKLVVAGCLMGRYPTEELRDLLPEVDAFLSPERLREIGELLSAEGAGRKARIGDGLERRAFLYDHTTPRVLSAPAYAYVKVAEGCDRGCTFCTIPRIKGPQHSRTPEDVAEEVAALAARGVREVNLVAQDLTAYGADLPGRPTLTDLLRLLVGVPATPWIRLLYAYPRPFPPGLLDLMAEEEAIVPYLDLPVQHAADGVLRRMGRGHGAADLRRLLAEVRARVPGIALRTTLLVGFPGETEEDFADLLAFVEEQTFEHLGVFVFSPEEGTAAAAMGPAVPRKVAVRRKRQLMALQRRLVRARNRGRVGRVEPVLVEGPSPETGLLLQGRTRWQAPEVDGVVLLNDPGPAGRLPVAGEVVQVEFTEAHDYDLVGRVVG